MPLKCLLFEPILYIFGVFILLILTHNTHYHCTWKKCTPQPVIHFVMCIAAQNFKHFYTVHRHPIFQHFYTVLSIAAPKIEFILVIGSPGLFNVLLSLKNKTFPYLPWKFVLVCWHSTHNSVISAFWDTTLALARYCWLCCSFCSWGRCRRSSCCCGWGWRRTRLEEKAGHGKSRKG